MGSNQSKFKEVGTSTIHKIDEKKIWEKDKKLDDVKTCDLWSSKYSSMQWSNK